MKKKKIIIWILAVIITLGAAWYQRISGPTYPKRIKIASENENYRFSLPRTHSSSSNCEILLDNPDNKLSGYVLYRKYPTNDPWDSIQMKKLPGELSAFLPKQPPAGKIEYHVFLTSGKEPIHINGDKAVVVRYKGDVPIGVIIPHVLLIFIAMLLANAAGLMAAFKISRARLYTLLTFIFMLAGGMLLGPVVQKYAFGAFWTGIPFGWDLTDNKTLFAFIAWIVALAANTKKFRPTYIIAAALITLIIFSMPHSMFGSELNYESGNIVSG